MKRGLFTVLFMILITTVFIAALAFIDEYTQERVEQNREIQRIQSIMYACNILPEGIRETDLPPTSTTADIPWDQRHLLELVQTRMQSIRLPITPSQKRLLENSYLSLQDSAEITILLNDTGGVEGYGFPLRGRGLWGTISAVGVVSTDLTRMIGIDFTEQIETPGLGARITESGFKYFFRGLDLEGYFDPDSNALPIVMVGKKTRSNMEEPSNSIQAITGATQTCNGVLDMVNTDVKFYLILLRSNKEALSKGIL
jgi:Na(+)-translocating NADH:ubiquinone oxidoreductase C subunit